MRRQATRANEAAEPIALEGTVERVTFYNPENGFSVVRVGVRGRREPVTVVGTLPAVQPGETLVLSGHWQIDPRHGAQFQPQQVEVRPPQDADGISRYLGSGAIPLIGPVLAERIAATFGAHTLAVLDNHPLWVRQVPGIGRQRAAAIADAWAEHRALRAVVAFLSEHQIDTRFAPRLLKAYGPGAPQILSANPYRLVSEVSGLGFNAADRIGQAIGVRATAAARLQAAVHAALLRAAEQGHTRQSRAALVETAASAAQSDPTLIDAAVSQLLASGVIAYRSDESGYSPLPGLGEGPGVRAETPASSLMPHASRSGRLQIFEPTPAPAVVAEERVGLGLDRLVRAEEELARRLRVLAGRPGQDAARVEGWLASDAEAGQLSPEQREAVRLAATRGCFILTGGPGVGKTTTVRALVRCLQALGGFVALAAPTGKAAKRLSQVVGLEARTIHRLLGAGPRGFRHGPGLPLPVDALIVDETSMLDTTLANALVRAVGERTQLILVGDADQLPSVGPGQVLRDLLASECLPAVRLETVFRQAAQSRIVTNAHRIRRGLPPELAPASALRDGIDCVFVPAAPDQMARLGAQWAADRLPRALGVAPGEVQALAPLNRVCQALNSRLQERLNPARGQAERPHGALPLRAGDRVIQTRNNYNLGVFNGDSGIITAIEPERVTVDFGDLAVDYAPADLVDLDHAYCLTVHRAQGSEWPGVVVLASSSHGPMLSRNLLYTALTRARRAVVIVGDEAALLARAVAETREQRRQTGLAALLAGMGPEA